MTEKATMQAIAALVSPGSRVLDLGCGDGALLAHLRDHRQVRGARHPAREGACPDRKA